MILSREQVYYTPELVDSGGRSMGISQRSDGSKVNVLLEWKMSAPADLGLRVAKALVDIPTDEDVNRPEEIRTLKFEGLFKVDEHSPLALVYKCAQKPLNLRDVLLTITKPSPENRRILGGIIATHIRSLNVHFRLQHTGLRTESFIFFSDLKTPYLTNPYVLDWGRSSSPSIYEHPEYQAGQSLWFHDVWSLMIVLSEVAEWKPVDGTFMDPSELLQKKLQRKREVVDVNWKGDRTAKIMQHGFGFLEKDRSTLENLSWKDMKRFFDTLCNLFEGS